MSEAELGRRILLLEKKVNFLLRELGLEAKAEEALRYGGPELQQVHFLIQNRRYIEAIKEYRLQTGVGLAEAKTAIDNLKKNMGLF